MEKTIYMEKIAIALQLPMVKLVDGSSGGGSVTTIRTLGYSYVPPLPVWTQVVKQLNMGIPNLGAVLGPAVGLGAARVAACHFSVMAADVGSLFNAGPQVVASEYSAFIFIEELKLTSQTRHLRKA
jgi:acetyl-CoA carboxylase carboxyltransferase component